MSELSKTMRDWADDCMGMDEADRAVLRDVADHIEKLELKLNRGITACDEVINQDRWEWPMPGQWRSEVPVAETIKQALEDGDE